MERSPTDWSLARVLARDWIFAGYPIAHWQHHDAEARPAWCAVVFVSLFDLHHSQFDFIFFDWLLDGYFYRQPPCGSFGECSNVHHCARCLGIFGGHCPCTANIIYCVGFDHTYADSHNRTLAPCPWAHVKRHAVLRWNFYYLRGSYLRNLFFIDQPCVDGRGYGVRPCRAAQNFALAHGVCGVGAACCNCFSIGVVYLCNVYCGFWIN